MPYLRHSTITLTRRQAVAGAAGAAFLCRAGDAIGQESGASAARDRLMQVLHRVTYGPTQRDVGAASQDGVDAYLEQQLAPHSIAEDPALEKRLATIGPLALSHHQLFQDFGPEPHPDDGGRTLDQRQALHQREIVIQEAFAENRLARAFWSKRQLQEMLVEFWFNHFNIFEGKSFTRIYIGSYDAAIREHALGSFRDLLGSIAHHPAMLIYLDNVHNRMPKAGEKEGGFNENYARELLELHTLGADSGYTQQDVIALARILSGWSVASGQHNAQSGEFKFDAAWHDPTDKHLLTALIKSDGAQEGEQALDLLADHPGTAKHIAFKLAQYFVADEPDEALVGRAARRFQLSKGNIRETLSEILRSPEFYSRSNRGTKFKTPYEYLASVIRSSGVPIENFLFLRQLLHRFDMPLFKCQTPDGYANTQSVWLNAHALGQRIEFATALASGKLPLLRPKIDVGSATMPQTTAPLAAAQLDPAVLSMISEKTRSEVAKTSPPLDAALVLASPEFMYR